jgi:hypothetical protein
MVHVHTNGYNNKVGFWSTLAKLPKVHVIFGIDGITQEVHEMHRVNTVLKDILRNALEYSRA